MLFMFHLFTLTHPAGLWPPPIHLLNLWSFILSKLIIFGPESCKCCARCVTCGWPIAPLCTSFVYVKPPYLGKERVIRLNVLHRGLEKVCFLSFLTPFSGFGPFRYSDSKPFSLVCWMHKFQTIIEQKYAMFVFSGKLCNEPSISEFTEKVWGHHH